MPERGKTEKLDAITRYNRSFQHRFVVAEKERKSSKQRRRFIAPPPFSEYLFTKEKEGKEWKFVIYPLSTPHVRYNHTFRSFIDLWFIFSLRNNFRNAYFKGKERKPGVSAADRMKDEKGKRSARHPLTSLLAHSSCTPPRTRNPKMGKRMKFKRSWNAEKDLQKYVHATKPG